MWSYFLFLSNSNQCFNFFFLFFPASVSIEKLECWVEWSISSQSGGAKIKVGLICYVDCSIYFIVHVTPFLLVYLTGWAVL